MTLQGKSHGRSLQHHPHICSTFSLIKVLDLMFAPDASLIAVHFPHGCTADWSHKADACQKHLQPFPSSAHRAWSISHPWDAATCPYCSSFLLSNTCVLSRRNWVHLDKYSQSLHFECDILQKDASIAPRDMTFWKVLSEHLLRWINPPNTYKNGSYWFPQVTVKPAILSNCQQSIFILTARRYSEIRNLWVLCTSLVPTCHLWGPGLNSCSGHK